MQIKNQGILIFTQQPVLDHKINDGKKTDGRYCFWSMVRLPKAFEVAYNLAESKRPELRLYFAVKGKVRGYFVIHGIDFSKKELIFYSESWMEIKDGEKLKSSQGFRYYPKGGV